MRVRFERVFARLVVDDDSERVRRPGLALSLQVVPSGRKRRWERRWKVGREGGRDGWMLFRVTAATVIKAVVVVVVKKVIISGSSSPFLWLVAARSLSREVAL